MAVQAAERALELTAKKDAGKLDALAAAYANAGRFDDAQTKLQEALEVAPSSDAADLKARLELYRQNQPYRQSEGAPESATSAQSEK